MNSGLDAVRDLVKKLMHKLAIGLNLLTRGKITPNMVTTVGLVAHLPIAWLIATNHPLKAALLLIIFGLFDSLDGQLARLQNRASSAGMLLDATTDRLKEVILYLGIAWWGINMASPNYGPSFWVNEIRWATLSVIVALGGSLMVSYVKAKGETALKDAKLSPNEINRLFQDGIARFEVRIAILIIGLLSGWLPLAVYLVAALAWLTVVTRLIKITRKLNG